MLNDKVIMITGGTGSFGKRFIKTVLERYSPKKLIVFSRDELKQFEMQQELSVSNCKSLRYFLGDIRDLPRLCTSMEGVDIVIHAAALKQVPAAEYNPFEAVKTNVFGGQNVIDAAISAGVKKVIALSTDKAAAPINLYGATKLCSDKLFIAANNYSGSHEIKFSVVRYGNVLGSRGSVVPFFLEREKTGILPITDERMTRFNITLQEGVDFVLLSLQKMWGGEIFVPKIPSYRIVDLAQAVSGSCKREFIGIRSGEKLHEELITSTDSLNSIEFSDYYVILPAAPPKWEVDQFIRESNDSAGRKITEEFSYNSGLNNRFLTVRELKKLISTEINV